VQLTTITTP